MAVDLIVRGIDKVVGDGTLTDDQAMAVSLRRGAIAAHVTAGAEVPSRHLSGKQVPPAWVVVRTDWNEGELDQHCAPWQAEPVFVWESLNENVDRWRVVVTSKLIRTRDSHGGMNQDRGKGFMDAWGFINQDYLANRTRGRATIFQMASSNGLWRVLGNSAFQDLSYDKATGEHVVRMDYGAVRPNKDVEVRDSVEEFATFVTQDTSANTIDFSIMRDDVKALFEENVRVRLEKKLARRRFALDAAEVDRIIVAGGYDEIPGTTLSQNMLDALDG